VARTQDDYSGDRAGGAGISEVARVTYLDMVRGWLTFQDLKQFLFFTRTPSGIRAGKEFLARLKERSENRDKNITICALQAQLKALRLLGLKTTRGPFKGPSARACRQWRQRPYGSKQQHLRFGATSPEQRSHHLSGFRTWGGIPISYRLRAQGARIPCTSVKTRNHGQPRHESARVQTVRRSRPHRLR
jgi:hypothetical protein